MTTKDQIEAAVKECAFKEGFDANWTGLRDSLQSALTACNHGHHASFSGIFQAGALWMQAEMLKLIEQRERVAWEAAREPRKWTQVFGPQSHIPEGQRYETFEDWRAQNANK